MATHLELTSTTNHGVLDRRPFDLAKQLQFHWSRAYTIWMTTWGWIPWYSEVPSGMLLQVARLGVLGIVGALVAPRGLAPLVVRRSLRLALAPLTLFFTLAVLAVQPSLMIQGRLLLPAGIATLIFVILGAAGLLRRVSGITPERAICAVAIVWIALLVWGNLRLLVPDERFQKPDSASRSIETHAVDRVEVAAWVEMARSEECEALLV